MAGAFEPSPEMGPTPPSQISGHFSDDNPEMVQFVDADGKVVSTDATFVPSRPLLGWADATYTATFSKGDGPVTPDTPDTPDTPVSPTSPTSPSAADTNPWRQPLHA